MTVTSWPLEMSSRARFQPTLPAPAITTYTWSASSRDVARRTARRRRRMARTQGECQAGCLASTEDNARRRSTSAVRRGTLRGEALDPQRALEHLDRVARGTDRVQPLLLVPLGPARVHHAHDDLGHAELLGGDLGDGEVRVVAVGGGDEDVGILDPGLAQCVDLQAVPDREAPAGVLPGGVHPRVEPLVGERILVQDRDLVARGKHRARHRGPDAARADDEYEGHWPGLYRAGPSSLAAAPSLGVAPSCATAATPSRAAARSARRRASTGAAVSEAGGAVRMIWHGALEITYFVASPTKSSSGPPRPPSSAPPRIFDGSSAARTTACTPRRLASSTIACPARRARTVAVATSTPSYSSPTAFARASAARACLSCASGSAASMGSDIGTSKIHSASMVAPLSSKASVSSSAARRPAVWMMSSSSGDPVSGTRIDPYSASWRSPRSAASGTRTRRRTDLPWVVR